MHKRLLLPSQVYLSLLIWGPPTALSHHYLPSPLLSFTWGHLTLAFRPQVFSQIGWLASLSATSLCAMLLSSSVAGLLRPCKLWFSSCCGNSADWLLWKCCSTRWPCTPLQYTLLPTLMRFTLCSGKPNVPCVFQGNKDTIRDNMMSGAGHQVMWAFNSKFWMIFWIVLWMEVGFLETGGGSILWGSSVIPQGNPQNLLGILKKVENFSVQQCPWKNTQREKLSAILTGWDKQMQRSPKFYNSWPYVIG